MQSKNFFSDLSQSIGQKEYKNAKKFAQYINDACKEKKLKLSDTNILLGYGGGKDSTWSLAFTRLAQLIARKEFELTFNLHIFSMVHLGTPRATLSNMEKVFNSLEIFDDDSIPYPQIYCYGQVADFTADYKIPEEQKNWLREDILLSGHRSFGNGRATFCQTCNLHMVNAGIYKIDRGMHFIITGDSTEELRSYYVWVQNILKQNNLLPLKKGNDCKANINCLLQINNNYYSDLMPSADYHASGRYCSSPKIVYPQFTFIPIFGFTKYSLKEHWFFFKNFLCFDFNDDVLNFTETDCNHPLLMCHLRGLSAKCEGRGYVAGVKEYLVLINYFFRKKKFHKNLIDANLKKFSSVKKINLSRLHAEKMFDEIGIDKTQTLCLLYSPVAEKGKNLRKYLIEQAPEFLPQIEEIKKYLSGDNKVKNSIKLFLSIHTGIRENFLRHLYLSPLFYPLCTRANEENFHKKNNSNILNSIIECDPHQKMVRYLDQSGEQVSEIIFGR